MSTHLKNSKFSIISIILFLSGVVFAVFIAPASAGITSVLNQYRGYIALDYEVTSTPWYINPNDDNRYFFADSADAITLCTNHGDGITNANLARLPVAGSSDSDDLPFQQQMKGKLLLQVESVGECWYVYPGDLKRYYIPNTAAAYQTLYDLGSNITNADLSLITIGSIHEITGTVYADIIAIPDVEMAGVDFFSELSDTTGGATIGGINTGGNGSGFVELVYDNTNTTISVTYDGLPDPPGGSYYNAWIDGTDENDFHHAGSLFKKYGVWMSMFTSTEDLSNHPTFHISIETSQTPEVHSNTILQGTFAP